MKTKVLQVFYNENGLPFKDQERTVHFPIVGSGFMGASNTTQIRFYFKEIGDDAVKYVAVSKLPNGKVGSKVLENYYDSELDEPYALLELDSYYTQYKGDLFISLQGYQGGVQVTYNEDTDLYEIEGTPTIQATGSIKFTNNYATQFVGSGEEQNITLQQLLAIISDTVLRYYVNSSNTLAEVFNEIGTKICAIDIEGDEYLCEMSGDTNIVLYDIHNQEWYAFTGANTTTIDEVMSSDNKHRIATKEELESFGNLFLFQGKASVSEINALTDIDNGWAYNLTDSGTLTLGNLQVETGDNVAFNGTIWVKLSSETVLGQYYTKEEGQAFESDIDERVTNVESELSSLGQGGPKGTYATVDALTSADPDHSYTYLVTADNKWYYWNGTQWTAGGTYLTAQLTDYVPYTGATTNVDLGNNSLNAKTITQDNEEIATQKDIEVVIYKKKLVNLCGGVGSYTVPSSTANLNLYVNGLTDELQTSSTNAKTIPTKSGHIYLVVQKDNMASTYARLGGAWESLSTPGSGRVSLISYSQIAGYYACVMFPNTIENAPIVFQTLSMSLTENKLVSGIAIVDVTDYIIDEDYSSNDGVYAMNILLRIGLDNVDKLFTDGEYEYDVQLKADGKDVFLQAPANIKYEREYKDLSQHKGSLIDICVKPLALKSMLLKQNVPFTITNATTQTYLCASRDNSFSTNLNDAKGLSIVSGHNYLAVITGTFANANGPVDSISFLRSGAILATCDVYKWDANTWFAILTPSQTYDNVSIYNGSRAGLVTSYTNGDVISSMVLIDLTEALGDSLSKTMFYYSYLSNKKAYFSKFVGAISTLANGDTAYSAGNLIGAASKDNLDSGTSTTTIASLTFTDGNYKKVTLNCKNSVSYIRFVPTTGLDIDYGRKPNDFTRTYINYQVDNFVPNASYVIQNFDNLNLYNQWEGKQWEAFGTSITDTNNTLAPDGTATGKYIPYLVEKVKPGSFINRGIAGGSICGHILYYIQYYLRNNMDYDGIEQDLITIEGSVNDWFSAKPLGQVGDTVPYASGNEGFDYGGNTSGTFAGGVYQCIKVVQDRCPKARIVMITDTTGKLYNSTDLTRAATNSLGLTQNDYIQMVIDVAKYMGVEVIDAGRKSQISENHPEYVIDQIHHTELGGEQYAQTIWNELKFISPIKVS